jgi:phosphatidylserine decarboxylase
VRPSYPHPLIAREGWAFIAIGVAAALAVAWLAGWGWSMPLWLAVLFVVQFFRDPPRDVPDDPQAVVSTGASARCRTRAIPGSSGTRSR